ncbi:MAG TPA: hypothetical protein VLT84_04225, partial [Acidobacteriota bacterium]|nr:hypothetical protein [Acidobacteriota bacterium]
MMSAIRHVVLAAILLFTIAAPASAQYMYLDSNGDGVNTAADLMNANGVATTVDVWLNTAFNRDGSPSVCTTGDGDVNIGSYYAILTVSGGTMSWGTPSDLLGFTVLAQSGSSTTELGFGRGSAAALNGGLHKLFTVQATGLSGAPSVGLVDFPAGISTGGNGSSFGTTCSTDDFDNTFTYLIEWSDFDGLGPAAGSPQNQNPSITVAPTANGTENVLFSLTANASDPDAGQLVTLSQTNDAPFLPSPSSNGPSATPSLTLSGTPSFTQSGAYTVNWSATDDFGTPGTANATTTITIANSDRAPIVTAPPTANGAEGSLLTVNVTASDPDGEAIASLTASGTAVTAGATFLAGAGNTSGTLSWTPGFSQSGGYAATFTAQNALNGTATTNITIANTNRPVALDPVADITVAEGAVANRTLVATDPDGSAVTYSAVLPAFASLVGDLITASPGFSDAGSYPSSATANSTDGTSDTENFTIIVTNTDRPVVLQPISDITVAEGSSSNSAVSASDPDGDTINLSATLPSFAALDAPVSGSGSVATTVTASPSAGDAAGSPYPASVTATTTGSSDTENFQIVVTAGDAPPVLAPIGNQTVAEGADVNVGISANDPDGTSISFEAVLPPFGALNAPTSGPSPLTSSYNLAPGYSAAGSYPSSITATSNGLSDTENFTIDVTN